jgi:four helix bundle protein
MKLDPEKLPVFAHSLTFRKLAERLISSAPRGQSDLVDQLRRASTSVVLNIAEGAGEFAPREKARFYRFARRSASECAALVEIFHQLGFIDDAIASEARNCLGRVIGQLVNLLLHLEGKRQQVAGQEAGGKEA